MPSLFAAYSQGKTSAADFSAAMKENAQISGALVRNNEKQAQDAAFQKILNAMGVGNNAVSGITPQLANADRKGYNGNI